MMSVYIGQNSSSTAPLTQGVPQGFILSPILFALYLLPLGSIFNKYGVSFHLYTDDVQLYLPLNFDDKCQIGSLLLCIKELESWLSLADPEYWEN